MIVRMVPTISAMLPAPLQFPLLFSPIYKYIALI
jgi:hypothetical protein